MWEFAAQHPIWFFFYLVTVCLSIMVIAASLFSTVRFVFVDLLRDKGGDDGGPDGGVESDPETSD